MSAGPAQPLSELSDAELVDAYLQHVTVEKRLADRTCQLYADALSVLLTKVREAEVDMRALSSHHIRRWVAALHSGGRSPRTIALTLSSWRGFFTWLGRQSLISHNPVQDVRAPKSGKPLPKALGVDESVQLASFRDTPGDPALDARDHCIVELLYGCGLRIGELVALDVQAGPTASGWIDLDEGVAHVTGKGNKRRAVPVGTAALDALREWLGVRAGLKTLDTALFVGVRGKRLSPQYIRTRLKQRSVQAGLVTPVHPHMLRHSYASHVLQSSGDLRAVQELLGHASISTTQVYTRLDFQHLAKVYDAAHPRAQARGGGSPEAMDAPAREEKDGKFSGNR
ncbi:tyrosine recombinase XerC [Hydrogenophaga sp. 5NK40-0174]|uniref:tyrosine recombinase XerC n=1 Tax=Hydrogenophaga sp. 5NK40-0174 TaxID=3127649 RepID=UPI003104A7A1